MYVCVCVCAHACTRGVCVSCVASKDRCSAVVPRSTAPALNPLPPTRPQNQNKITSAFVFPRGLSALRVIGSCVGEDMVLAGPFQEMACRDCLCVTLLVMCLVSQVAPGAERGSVTTKSLAWIHG